MTADLRAPSAIETEVRPSAPRSRTDEWLTPPSILSALGPFDLDPCAPADRPWDTAAIHYTASEDGLMKPWFGRVWLNPPYRQGQIERFMARMAGHGRGTALVNASTDTEWFARFVWDGATAILFVYQRMRFVPSTGLAEKTRNHNRAASALVAYGPDDADRLAGSGIAGAFVPLAVGQLVAVIRPSGTDANVSWNALIRTVVEREGGTVVLEVAYVLVARHPKSAANPHWRAKVRQVLQGSPFERVAPATYRLKLDVVPDRPRARAS